MRMTHARWQQGLKYSALVLGAVLVTLIVTQKPADADARCHMATGRITLIPMAGPGCTSPVGVCGTGDFSGTLTGPYTSALTTMIPTQDTPMTGDVLITGDTTMDARLNHWTGTLQFKDAGAFKTIGEGNYAELFTVVGGTNDFAGASGTIYVVGTYDFAAGGTGTYYGRICVP